MPATIKPEKYTASKVATTVPELVKRIEQLEKGHQRDLAQRMKRDTWIQLCLTTLLALCRWAYAWSKAQNDPKRMANFKDLGQALKDALDQIEPDF